MNHIEKSFGKFMLLWSGDFISAIGSGLTSFGLSVYIFQQTGKASSMALITLLAFLPSLLLGPIAGVLADRYDRRLLMVLGGQLFCGRSAVHPGEPYTGGSAALANLCGRNNQLCVRVTLRTCLQSHNYGSVESGAVQ